MEVKKHYKYLDAIRVLFCIAIFLYHLNILKGGYLAVCSFFVLSGYLSCLSASKKNKFYFKDYYINRLTKIYLPLIIVVFMSIPIVLLFKEVIWLNLKPEVTSIILGYNNFWQINANLDYFARHINSPFMHLWYVSILLQFDLVFPFIYISFKKIGEKIKWLPCLILFILGFCSFTYFYVTSSSNIMVSYYDTLARLFSLLFGLTFGFVYCFYGTIIGKIKENATLSKVIFYIYLITLGIMFIFVDDSSPFFRVSMILTTFITCRLICYGILISNQKFNMFDKIIKFISSISYEIYLIQYPVIFLFQYIKLYGVIKYLIITILLIILSYILHFSLDKDKKHKILKYILLIFIIGFTCFGAYKYITAKDHTREIKELEEQLAKNKELIKQKQKEYEKKLNDDKQKFEQMLKEVEEDESKLKDVVSALPVIGIGDSVMLGASPNLYQTFPNGYFDAQISRTGYVINDILLNLKSNNMLGGPVILNVGANGDCSDDIKDQIMNTLSDKQVFWVNVTNDHDVYVNEHLLEYSKKYSNLHIIDWNSISSGHYEYFIADGIHLTDIGRQAYSKAIYDAIYNEYLKEFTMKKDEIIKNREEEFKTKIAFYGNDVLLNVSLDIQNNFNVSAISANDNYDFELLKNNINEAINNNVLSYKVVFMFDSKLSLSDSEYLELINLCKDHDVYFVLLYDNSFYNENIKYINFYDEIKKHNEYLMADKVHLTNSGNDALITMLRDYLK